MVYWNLLVTVERLPLQCDVDISSLTIVIYLSICRSQFHMSVQWDYYLPQRWVYVTHDLPHISDVILIQECYWRLCDSLQLHEANRTRYGEHMYVSQCDKQHSRRRHPIQVSCNNFTIHASRSCLLLLMFSHVTDYCRRVPGGSCTSGWQSSRTPMTLLCSSSYWLYSPSFRSQWSCLSQLNQQN